MTSTIGGERVDEITARLGDDFLWLAVLDHDQAATLRADIQFFSDQGQTGDLQKAWMIFVSALQRFIGNRFDCEGQTGSSFTRTRSAIRGSFYFTVKNLSPFGSHDGAVSLRRN